MSTTIIMYEDYWRNSHFSIARFYGGINYNGVNYIIVNKEGKDLFECTVEAEKEGRGKAIPAGEPADLIDKKYQSIYRKVGRDKFIEMVESGMSFTEMKKQSK